MSEENNLQPENQNSETVESNDIETVKRSLAEEKEKATKYLNNWQRAEADFSNYRKRTEQEKNDTIASASSRLIFNILPVLDDLDRALLALPPEITKLTWVDGIWLIQRKLRAILEAEGLTEIESVGKSFDPSLHEAVAHTEGKEGTVINEVQKGYRLKNKLLRPALVVVGKAKEQNSNENPQ